MAHQTKSIGQTSYCIIPAYDGIFKPLLRSEVEDFVYEDRKSDGWLKKWLYKIAVWYFNQGDESQREFLVESCSGFLNELVCALRLDALECRESILSQLFFLATALKGVKVEGLIPNGATTSQKIKMLSSYFPEVLDDYALFISNSGFNSHRDEALLAQLPASFSGQKLRFRQHHAKSALVDENGEEDSVRQQILKSHAKIRLTADNINDAVMFLEKIDDREDALALLRGASVHLASLNARVEELNLQRRRAESGGLPEVSVGSPEIRGLSGVRSQDAKVPLHVLPSVSSLHLRTASTPSDLDRGSMPCALESSVSSVESSKRERQLQGAFRSKAFEIIDSINQPSAEHAGQPNGRQCV